MEPVTVGFIALNLLLLGYDRFGKKKAPEAPGGARGPEPMLFTPAAVEKFTRMQDGVRHFGALPQKGIRADLELRSVIPQAVPPHIQGKASAFRVVPMMKDGTTAAEVVRKASEQGAVVLGSLSLVALMSGIDTSFVLLVTNADGARELAPERDQSGMPAAWAILAEPAIVVAQPQPAPAAAPDIKPPAPIDMSGFQRISNGVVMKPPEGANGVAKPAPPAPAAPETPSSAEGA